MAMVVSPRTVGLMAATALAAGWMGATITQSPPPAQSRVGDGARPAALPASIPRAENLRLRMTEPPLPSRGRNPFVYGPRLTTIRDHQQHGAEAVVAAVSPIAVAPSMPMFRLSGIASNAEGGATVLTAILNDNGAMVFAKAGDKLSNGYSVVRVDETSVTLVDAAGVTQTIRLP